MKTAGRKHARKIIDVGMLMELKICPACGQSFNLGDPVVMASGAWDGPPKLIHEYEAVFDPGTSSYIDGHIPNLSDIMIVSPFFARNMTHKM